MFLVQFLLSVKELVFGNLNEKEYELKNRNNLKSSYEEFNKEFECTYEEYLRLRYAQYRRFNRKTYTGRTI